MVQRCMDGHGERNHGQLDVVFGFTQIQTKIMGTVLGVNVMWICIEMQRSQILMDVYFTHGSQSCMELDEFLAVGSFQILEVHRVMSMVALEH